MLNLSLKRSLQTSIDRSTAGFPRGQLAWGARKSHEATNAFLMLVFVLFRVI